MNLYVGTSGYSYKEWKGSFYPEDLPEKQITLELEFSSGTIQNLRKSPVLWAKSDV